MSFNGINGTICDDSWDITDGSVLCRQLGFGPALEVSTSTSLQLDTFFMDDVNCRGNESHLLECEFTGWDAENCSPWETATVTCDFNGK